MFPLRCYIYKVKEILWPPVASTFSSGLDAQGLEDQKVQDSLQER